MRLFVAVWPPADVVDRLLALPRPAVDGLRWTGPEQWHVTLSFLGPLPLEEALAGWGRLLAGVVPGPVSASMGPAVARLGDRILHVPVAGLDDLAATVAGAGLVEPPGGAGSPRPRGGGGGGAGPRPVRPVRPFRGHLTLARVAERHRRPGVDLRPLVGIPLAAAWPVEEVTLVRSHLGGPAARYEARAAPFGECLKRTGVRR